MAWQKAFSHQYIPQGKMETEDPEADRRTVLVLIKQRLRHFLFLSTYLIRPRHHMKRL